MNKTDIDWADMTWNPVTGCLKGCEYCYAKKIAIRFGGTVDTCPTDSIHVLDEPFVGTKNYDNDYKVQPYPYMFDPTFHRYRLDEPAKNKKPQTIFVGSMCDLFGDWVPDEWIEQVFEACRQAGWHTYLFLTKNVERYWKLHDIGILPKENNYWFGATLTKKADVGRTANHLPQYTGRPEPTHRNTFVSMEPLHDDVSDYVAYYRRTARWVIVGAETGACNEKIIPKHDWIENIVADCELRGVPLFMKKNIVEIWGGPLIQEYPW